MHTLSLNILLALSVVLPLTAQATPRVDEYICEEIAEVLNEAVTLGTLSQEHADDITDRCYVLYY